MISQCIQKVNITWSWVMGGVTAVLACESGKLMLEVEVHTKHTVEEEISDGKIKHDSRKKC